VPDQSKAGAALVAGTQDINQLTAFYLQQLQHQQQQQQQVAAR